MHIDLCLLATDLNKLYYNLYPYIKKAWNKMNIDTKLILISNFIPDILKEYSDDIILFKPIDNIHSAYIAQVIRILYPCLFINKNILISDIDIIPLNKNYFNNDYIKNISNEKFIVFRDVYIKTNMIAICYNLANSNVWKKIFKINNEIDIINKLKEWYNPEYDGKKNCLGWFTDQKILFKYLHFNEKYVIYLNDKDLKFNRLDKRNKKYIIDNLNLIYNNIKSGYYTDFHIIRPYHKYTVIIKRILDLI